MDSLTLHFVVLAGIYFTSNDITGIAALKMPLELVTEPIEPIEDETSPPKVPHEFDPEPPQEDFTEMIPLESDSPLEDTQEFFSKRVFLPYDSSTPDADESQRIVDGFVTSTAAYPHQVWMRSSIGSCGGSLISLQTVLTAAHCVVNGSSVNVTFGRSAAQPNGELIVTGTALRHPGYNGATLANDIALVIFANPVTITTNIRPARIVSSTTTNEIGKAVTITGYGLTTYGGSVQTALRAAPVTVTGTDGPTVLELSNTLDIIFPYKTSCNGDSGGPATFNNPSYALVVGITSYGYGRQCGGTGPDGGWLLFRWWVNKSYYTRVSSYTTWILANAVGTVDTGTF